MSKVKTSIDFLSGVGSFATMNQTEKFIRSLTSLLLEGDEFFIDNKPIRIGKQYQLTIKSVYKLCGGIKVDEDRVELALQLPGTFCRAMENQEEGLRKFFESMRPTRLDGALDDGTRRISQEAVNTIGNKGDYVGVDSYKLISSKGSQEDDRTSSCYFGSSNKSVRFYNAEAVHGIKADRWETTFRSHYSEQAVIEILDNSKYFAETIGGLVTGSIDFVERGHDYRHQPRYKFWQSMRDELPEILLKAPSQEYCIAKTLRWLDKQVSPSLGVIKEGIGKQAYSKYMMTLAERGTERFTENHYALVKQLKKSEVNLNGYG